MSSRDAVLASIRRSLGVRGDEKPRRAAVTERLNHHPAGVIPARGQGDREARCDLFRTMMEHAAGTVDEIARTADVPAAISAFLRSRNLPMSVRRGGDPRLAAMPWERERTLEVTTGPSDGNQLVAVSHAFGGVAETGTLMLISGTDNPTTLNFLPDTHIVVVKADDVAGDYESLWQRLRQDFSGRTMPRTVNMITGPSRSADIEQTLILGAHGPRQLHVIVVRD